ncbi:MAG: hypothetical protein HGA67_02780 [Candidatus Yonathbacteria bacterium]|nr:hypothetical protein [Candidatus Yonathbacteria bacterium]
MTYQPTALGPSDIYALYKEEWNMVKDIVIFRHGESENEAKTRIDAWLEKHARELGTVTLLYAYCQSFKDNKYLVPLKKRLEDITYPIPFSSLMYINGTPLLFLPHDFFKALRRRTTQEAKKLPAYLIEQYFTIYEDSCLLRQIAQRHPEKERLLAFLNKNS